MNMTIIEGQSILKPPYFDGTNYTDWKELMKIFIQSVDFKIWLVIKNGPKIPKKLVDNQEVEKCEEEFDDEDMKNMELEAKAKYILRRAINPNAFEQLSNCETAKQMWDNLDSLYFDREMTIVNSTMPQRNVNSTVVGSIPDNAPNLEFLAETREAMDQFLKYCVPLHKLALEGNWPAAKLILEKDNRLKYAALATGLPTVLHVAAGTNHVRFVEKLLQELEDEHIALQDIKGNTAFCFATASGNMDIVRLLLRRDSSLATRRGANGYTPIQFAALQGKCEMTCFLYDMTKPEFNDPDWELLFFTCINTGNYHLALTMAMERKWLAESRDENGDTALHLLALIQKPLECQCHCPEHQNPIGMKKHVVFQLVNFLWTTLFSIKDSKSEIIKIISEPYQLLFDAAVVGNFGFLSELISIHPSLIWEVDNKNKSIIHTAVSYRHASIFNLIHEIGPLKDIIVTYSLEENNTLLHLAAKLAPSGRLELISGAAFQMWLELLWFEEVKKIMQPSYIKRRNFDGLTAEELFTKEHEGLRKKAEEWMKRTAEFGMLISTVIATGVFSAAINIPGGIDDQTKKPNYLGKSSFQVFALSDATALISSVTAILIFLSILISRYAESDFYGSLPLKLMFGLITLFISITSMMVAFGSAFFITYYYGLKWIPILSSVLASLPILLYIALQLPLWSDIICSFCNCTTLFKPRKRMITYYL